MAIPRVLLVDDDELIRVTLAKILGQHGFEVMTAGNVAEALGLITSETFDVLLTDLHMPGAGDGLTVVSAMRHANPSAVTLLLSAFPEMGAAADAILMQADEILVKPMNVLALVELIKSRLVSGVPPPRQVESVATILERTAKSITADWYGLVGHEKKLTAISMTHEQRCGHLPQVFRDLVQRLRGHEPLGTRGMKSPAAIQHGADRRKQGYTAAMMVEESRMLQVSIFEQLQKNLATIDFSVLLLGVMTIADEVDSQLSQAMASYTAESIEDSLPVLA